MDAGFYSADYLRAWIRSSQLRAQLVEEVGEDWWRSPETGDRLRALFFEGTRPSSEEIAARLGFDPLDTGPLLHELGARVGDRPPGEKSAGMREKSQLDDMRAAIRGDLERSRARRDADPWRAPEPRGGGRDSGRARAAECSSPCRSANRSPSPCSRSCPSRNQSRSRSPSPRSSRSRPPTGGRSRELLLVACSSAADRQLCSGSIPAASNAASRCAKSWTLTTRPSRIVTIAE